MSLTKRQWAVISVATTLDDSVILPDVEAVATQIVDQLIEDGLLPLTMAGQPDVAAIIDQFQLAFHTTAPNKTDRFAAARLAKRHGSATVVYIIQEFSKRTNEKYAPTINNVTQLEQKWPTIVRFVSSSGASERDL
jgi:hypothetical protein